MVRVDYIHFEIYFLRRASSLNKGGMSSQEKLPEKFIPYKNLAFFGVLSFTEPFLFVDCLEIVDLYRSDVSFFCLGGDR